jgi:hypothetical protein
MGMIGTLGSLVLGLAQSKTYKNVGILKSKHVKILKFYFCDNTNSNRK